MIKYLFCFCLIFKLCPVSAQQLNLIPYPKQVEQPGGSQAILKSTKFIINDKRFSGAAGFLNSQLYNVGKTSGTKLIVVKINTGLGVSGSYTLNTKATTIGITAADKDGVFNGIVTLLQLCKMANSTNSNYMLPKVIIHDAPRYQWRGFMLDESRHFFGKAVVKDILNWMAFYKLNRFHWHLTDAQGWRFEVKKYPLLATIGGRGSFTDSTANAKYYSQADIKEIVAYAAERNITIIPEFDMPGHATAANNAYPQYSGGSVAGYQNFTFNPAKDSTYTFITDILKEVKGLFPSNMIHIGGDEVALGIKAWEKNPAIKKMMADKAMTDLQQAEFYFLRRVADSVKRLNSTVMCWDEAVPAGLAVNNTIINWWRQNKPESLTAALSKNYKVILCPRLPMYFDFVQDSTHRSGRKWGKLYNTYLDVYHFPENALADSINNNSKILGLQANLWTETVVSVKRLQYLLFPRMAALAEAGWNVQAAKNDMQFSDRLKSHLNLYSKAGIYFYDPFNPAATPEAIDIKPAGDVND